MAEESAALASSPPAPARSHQQLPAKIRDLTLSLMVNKDVAQCLEVVKQQYPNVATRRNILSKIRAAIVDHNVRDDAYERTLRAYEERLTREYQACQARGDATGAQQLMARLSQIFHFRGCDLRRQIQVQKKLSVVAAAKKCDICHEQDRDFFLRLPLVPDWVRAIRLETHEARALAVQQQRSLVEQSANVVRIENADDLVVRCRTILRQDDADVCDLALALALSTGRRMVEVFLLGEFAEHPHRRYAVYFRGQAKSGLRSIQSIDRDQPLEYLIPTLATGSSIVRGVSRLRGLVHSMPKAPKTPKDINSAFCRKLNVHVKRHVHSDITFHDLRTMYALMTYEAFKPHRFSLNLWVANTLGHGSMAMSVHYTRMQIYGLSRIARHKVEAAEDFTENAP